MWASESLKRYRASANERQKGYRESNHELQRQAGRDRYRKFSDERRKSYIRERSDYHKQNPEVAKKCYNKNPVSSYYYTVKYPAKLKRASIALKDAEKQSIKSIYRRMKHLND